MGSLTTQAWRTAGTFLMMANGADAPRLYDGTTWTTASVTATGLTTTNIIAVHNHMNRLWLIEENQLHVWYLSTSAIAGSAMPGCSRNGERTWPSRWFTAIKGFP